jgi:predicted  nucleic acid-binding Zn-ribbon protein
MEQQIDFLTSLQNIEINSKVAKLRIAEISKQYDALDQRLRDFETLMAQETQQTDTIKKEYRDYETNVEDNLNLVAKSKDKLAQAKNNKEYQSSLKEIEELEKKNSTLEDSMLEILDKIETAENRIKERSREHSDLSGEIEQNRLAISAEIEEKNRELEKLNKDLQEARDNIEPGLMEIFEKTKNLQANKIAMARVVDAICQGCNVNVPPQLYNELQRRDSFKFCPKCGRIIYWSESAR